MRVFEHGAFVFSVFFVFFFTTMLSLGVFLKWRINVAWFLVVLICRVTIRALSATEKFVLNQTSRSFLFAFAHSVMLSPSLLHGKCHTLVTIK
ncbi:hypothetical protein BZG80_05255 [Salinivibrio sp. MA440]|nr:hypothetical protein BZG80_05255 [Salinivibrio sp. MA440]